MPIETPPVKPTAPTPPDRSDRANFPTQMYDEFVFLNGDFIDYVEAAGANVENNATEAATQASTATTQAGIATTKAAEAAASAASAAATSNVTKWVSGTSYAEGDCVWSPATFQTYRRKSAGGGTTDPSAAPTVWELLGTVSPGSILYLAQFSVF